MKPSTERTPDHEGRKAAASLLLIRIALGLVQDARLAGGFGADEAALQLRADSLVTELSDGAGGEPGRAAVEVQLRSGGRIELTVPFDEGFREWAEVREDGVVLGGGTGGPSRRWTLRPEDMTPQEVEEQQRRGVATKAARGKPKFRGKRYLRTLVAPPQPGAAERILAVELYADGLIVEFTYDNELPSEEEMESMFFPPRPPMRIEDDVGTDYYEGERASYGGGPVSHSYFTFAPAVPAGAGVLRITTDSGTVEVTTGT